MQMPICLSRTTRLNEDIRAVVSLQIISRICAEGAVCVDNPYEIVSLAECLCTYLQDRDLTPVRTKIQNLACSSSVIWNFVVFGMGPNRITWGQRMCRL